MNFIVRSNYRIFIFILLCSVILLIPKIIFGAENIKQVNVFSTEPIEKINSFYSFGRNFQGGSSVAACDVNNDGLDEIIVGAGTGGGPQIRIFNRQGQPLFTPGFFAYDPSFKGGVNVACGDLDNNGQAEIVTAPKSNGGPHIRIFNHYGQPIFTNGFYAYAPELKGGLNIVVGDIDGGGIPEIITAPAYGSEPQVKIFNRFGNALSFDIYPFDRDFKGGVSLAVANVDGGEEDELVMGVQSYDSAWVKILKVGKQQTILGNFLAFKADYQGGVNVAGGDMDNDGYDEIIVAANNGTPQVLAFEANGEKLDMSFYAYDKNFKNGVEIESGDTNGDGHDELMTAPGSLRKEGRTDLRKYIEVDISDQRMFIYENGQKIGDYIVSTGKTSMPTPLGEFKIMNKAPQAYSKKYGLYMPYWMQITSAGHGIHGLPFWKLKGGGVIYEGESHLGKRVSHGCIRLPVDVAGQVFKWAETGTTVIIHM